MEEREATLGLTDKRIALLGLLQTVLVSGLHKRNSDLETRYPKLRVCRFVLTAVGENLLQASQLIHASLPVSPL